MDTPYGSRVESSRVAPCRSGCPLTAAGVSFYDCVVLVRRFPPPPCGTPRSAAACGGGGIERGPVLLVVLVVITVFFLYYWQSSTRQQFCSLCCFFFYEVVNYVALELYTGKKGSCAPQPPNPPHIKPPTSDGLSRAWCSPARWWSGGVGGRTL